MAKTVYKSTIILRRGGGDGLTIHIGKRATRAAATLPDQEAEMTITKDGAACTLTCRWTPDEQAYYKLRGVTEK